MKQKILNYIEKNPYTSFAELSKYVDGFKGGFALTNDQYPNIILWPYMSEYGAKVIHELIVNKEVEIQGCSTLVYIIDGIFPDMPLAKKLIQYKKPRWLPVTLRKAA